jgi:hypothetical protein
MTGGFSGEGALSEYMSELESRFEYSLEETGDKKKKKERTARMEMRCGKVNIGRSESLTNRKAYPEQVEIQVVYVKEKEESAPEGERPIEWTLYTAYSVENKEEALKVAGYYQSKWLIEDFFRTIKSEGLNYEGSELEGGPALEKQRNPCDRENLAWAVWYIARTGGWKGHANQRPPGAITLRYGWIRFQSIFLGWCAAKDMYKR